MKSFVDGSEVDPFMMDEEEVPDDLDNTGGGLEGMSSDDSGSFVLSESQAKLPQLSRVIAPCLRFLASVVKSPLNAGIRCSSSDCGSCLCHF